MQVLVSDKRLPYWAAGLSFVAGLVHMLATSEHFNEWWGYGTFFILIATCQVFYGILLLVQPWRYDDDGSPREDSARSARLFYLVGAVATGAAILLFIITRTVGIPFVGPDAGSVEPVTALGMIAQVVEAGLCVCLVVLVKRSGGKSVETTAGG